MAEQNDAMERKKLFFMPKEKINFYVETNEKN